MTRTGLERENVVGATGRVVAFVEGAQGLQTLEELTRHSIEVAVVVPEGFDNRLIEVFSKTHRLELMVRPRGVALDLTGRGFDLLVSSQFQFRIQASEWEAARLGGVNIHASILPTYRGKHSDVWALINDEPEIGVTVHRLSPEFDGGEILHIERVAVSDTFSNTEIYARVAARIPVIVAMIADGSVFDQPPQPAAPDVYWRVRTQVDSQVSWHVSARKVFTFVRALARAPIWAFTTCSGRRLEIHEVAETGHTDVALPGTVRILDGLPHVVCGDRRLVRLVHCSDMTALVDGRVLH